MITFINERARSRSGWVTDIEGFRRWTDSAEFPTNRPTWWLRGEVWVDLSKEQIFTHVLVKTELTAVLDLLADENKLGTYLTSGVLLSNFAADISGNPDGLFISHETRSSDRIRLIEGKDNGFVELQGTPDMVLEIISASSIDKDDVQLRQAYWDAGIPEYWIVDVRKEPIRFDILRHTARSYVNSRKQGGWIKSGVFGKSFRLLASLDDFGDPEYRLEVR